MRRLLALAALALLPTSPAAADVHVSPHPAASVRHWQRAMLFRRRVTPFRYAGHWWAAPYPIALCESGGDYFVGPYGAYGLILEPTWMAPREQDRAAHRLYKAYGEAPWAPFEAGCAYR